ncbi:helper-TIM [Schizosaccharomyces japonicus yFS275]|uniref:Helper-TIM n=1 Tax=Schizosaccharomyces japonicus (strain yFS275 / FY16936) TaxID=402676 RepID=B6JY99_SCHJY|nr:helper-TIM [Schizosaccharomyces japonicus yFS275]EEB06517.1 helper-TIM [Schizosaccharomyces japonicus yFS275]
MCKHIKNAQVSIRTACCHRWVDCVECHNEIADHPLLKTAELTLICKKCRKAFRKNLTDEIDESDEYCPHCDNHYVIPAVTEADVERKRAEKELEKRRAAFDIRYVKEEDLLFTEDMEDVTSRLG